MNSVYFVVLRRMRAPLIALIVIYAVSVLGLTLVPGVTADGQPAPPLSFFHAFYFISYTATTIGFGEIPNAFSDAQRLWVIVCIYLTVIGWSYSILTLLALLQDKAFQNTLVASRFAWRVRKTQPPFHLVCGCGETGSLICHTLDELGQGVVILEKDEQRVQELDLEDFRGDYPTLAADARLPANLIMAGLQHPKCRGVLAVTNDDDTNLAIAIASRLLSPHLPVLARARNPLVAANLASFGTHHIINPFERFAQYLAQAVAAPECFHLMEILTGLPGRPLPEEHRPPRGHWIVCGYGRFGQAVVRNLAPAGIDLTVIDPENEGPGNGRIVCGLGTEAGTLREAGIETATGIVAGSDEDVNNLSIAMTAKEIRPDIFVVVRQNQAANSILFDAFDADFAMIPSRIVAQECIAILTTPLLARFLEAVRQADEAWCREATARIKAICRGRVPTLWGQALTRADARAAHDYLGAGKACTLGELLRDNSDRERPLPALVLMVERRGEPVLLPGADFRLEAEDALLVAGPGSARRSLELTARNANVLDYVLTGREWPNGWVWQKLLGSSKKSA